MRRILAGLAIAGLASAGCGGGDASDAAPTTVTVTVTAEPTETSASSSPPTSASPTSSSAAPQAAGVGETVAFEDLNGSGSITLNGIRRITKAEGPIGGAPSNGGYVVIDVTVTAESGSVTPNPLAFKAVGPDGRTYSTALGVVQQQIDSGELPAGRSARGDVAFDAPPGDLLIDYALIGRPLATFRISS